MNCKDNEYRSESRNSHSLFRLLEISKLKSEVTNDNLFIDNAEGQLD